MAPASTLQLKSMVFVLIECKGEHRLRVLILDTLDQEHLTIIETFTTGLRTDHKPGGSIAIDCDYLIESVIEKAKDYLNRKYK